MYSECNIFSFLVYICRCSKKWNIPLESADCYSLKTELGLQITAFIVEQHVHVCVCVCLFQSHRSHAFSLLLINNSGAGQKSSYRLTGFFPFNLSWIHTVFIACVQGKSQRLNAITKSMRVLQRTRIVDSCQFCSGQWFLCLDCCSVYGPKRSVLGKGNESSCVAQHQQPNGHHWMNM